MTHSFCISRLHPNLQGGTSSHVSEAPVASDEMKEVLDK
jgi:hypothetical protein